jgi:hypothetical protein
MTEEIMKRMEKREERKRYGSHNKERLFPSTELTY